MTDQTILTPDPGLSSSPIDIVDAVFLRRLHPDPAAPAAPSTAAEIKSEPTPAEKPAVAAPVSTPPRSDTIDVDESLVEWLLKKVPQQWAALATTVEQAAADGRRVIAVAGGGRGEGRTTLVAGLAATLTARGWRAFVVAGPLTEAGETFLESDGDRQVVIVDAGVWFPPGIEQAGCHVVGEVVTFEEPHHAKA
jgi:Mrp family chromosome partitioning ATPase